jgi:hypothetical protein
MRVEGRIIGHDNVFDDEGLGQAGAWDNLAYGYRRRRAAWPSTKTSG